MTAPVLLLIDGEWLLPRRPPAGLWTFIRPDLTSVLDLLVDSARELGAVRRVQCYRNWSDRQVSTEGSIIGPLQRRLVELHHVPVPIEHGRGFRGPNREGVASAIRAAATEHLLAHSDGVVAIASDESEAVGGLFGERLVALPVVSVPPLWKEAEA